MSRRVLTYRFPIESLRSALNIPDSVAILELYQDRGDRLAGCVNIVLEHPGFPICLPGCEPMLSRFWDEVAGMVEGEEEREKDDQTDNSGSQRGCPGYNEAV